MDFMSDSADDTSARLPRGIRLFTPPPAGFDPMKASDRELLAHGYPARPDRERQADLYRHWLTMMSRPMSVITPQFDTSPGPRGGGQFRYADTVGNGWAGSEYIVADGGDPVTFVSGQWTVPAVVPPQGDHGLTVCATWIGIDNTGDAGDIVQAGTTQQVTYGDSPATFAWFQWYPASSSTISNLDVSPGDVMYCVICVYSSSEVAVHLLNTTTGTLASFVKDGSAENLSVTGHSAEWILESPLAESGDPTILTKFGDVYFDNCIAGTSGQDGPQTILGGNYAAIIMEGDDDDNIVNIAAPQPLNERAFKVQYVVPL
jgi:Peptidase A4 family